jgi:hypothetical protein
MCGQVAGGLDRDVGGQQPEAAATARCARCSAVSDTIRNPVNRRTTITLASASMPLPSAQPTRAIDPAAAPAIRPTAPSAAIRASDDQASQRA